MCVCVCVRVSYTPRRTFTHRGAGEFMEDFCGSVNATRIFTSWREISKGNFIRIYSLTVCVCADLSSVVKDCCVVNQLTSHVATRTVPPAV